MKKQILAICLFSFFFIQIGLSCTTAVVSGRFTKNGKSLIWKVRDTDNLENSMRFFKDGKYTYLGLVDSKDTEGKSVWGGSNSAGFAIMNSASFNVNENDTTNFKDQEGAFMKLALQTCANLQEFETLLNNRVKPMGLAAHFGVIDANGGAAFYEVYNYTWTKFDANSTPEGYVIRTNYSETGTKNEGLGFIRRQTATKLFGETKMNTLTPQIVMQNFSRCFYHPVFDIDYRQNYEIGKFTSEFISSDDLITRHGTSSNILIEGVKKGEPGDLNTLWIQVGYPETSVSLPLWVRGGENIPSVLKYDTALKNSPLNNHAMQWKKDVFPIGRSDGYHYMNMAKLVNPQKTGYLQRIEEFEKGIFELTNDKVNKWNSKTSKVEIENYYELLNKKVTDFYSNSIFEKK